MALAPTKKGTLVSQAPDSMADTDPTSNTVQKRNAQIMLKNQQKELDVVKKENDLDIQKQKLELQKAHDSATSGVQAPDLQSLFGQSPEEKQLRAQLRQKLEASTMESKDAVSQQEVEIDRRLKDLDSEPDLKMIASGVDLLTGSDSAKNFEGKDERMRALLKDKKDLIQSKRDVDKLEIDSLQSQLKTLSDNTLTKAMLAGQKDEGTWARRASMDNEAIIKSIEKDVINPMRASEEFFHKIDSAIKGKTVAEVFNTLSLFARQVAGEKGVLTDSDIGRVVLPTLSSYLSVLEAKLTSDPLSKMDEGTLMALKKTSDNAKTAAKQKALSMMGDRKTHVDNSVSIQRFPEISSMSNRMIDTFTGKVNNTFMPSVSALPRPEDVPEEVWSSMSEEEKQQAVAQ